MISETDSPRPKTKMAVFYLFSSPAGRQEESASTVFYRTQGESIAKSLCSLFSREYGDLIGHPAFHYHAAAPISVEEQVLLDESLGWVAIYGDPDPGIYDPPPTKHLHFRAQCALRAQEWERLLRERAEPREQNDKQETNNEAHPDPATTDQLAEMPADDRRNSCRILLMLLAQAYYKLLESTISMASWVTVVDLELNQSYLWTVKSITNLLKNDEQFKDFPVPFEPLFPDLFPSTIGDIDWEDMVAPEAERFLSTVQQYVHNKGVYEPEKGTPAWIFVELFRPGINTTIKRAIGYNDRMRKACARLMGSPATEAPGNERRDKSVPKKHIFVSYCRDNRKQIAKLRDDLIAAGEQVWWDQNILAGQDWKHEIRKAMRDAYAVVLCLSTETADRITSGIYPEILDAIAAFREYSPGGIFLIPVRVSECEIPLIEIDATRTLDRLQFVDLFPPSKRADGLKKLIQAIQAAPHHR